jgi:hypothetical protein
VAVAYKENRKAKRKIYMVQERTREKEGKERRKNNLAQPRSPAQSSAGFFFLSSFF